MAINFTAPAAADWLRAARRLAIRIFKRIIIVATGLGIAGAGAGLAVFGAWTVREPDHVLLQKAAQVVCATPNVGEQRDMYLALFAFGIFAFFAGLNMIGDAFKPSASKEERNAQ